MAMLAPISIPPKGNSGWGVNMHSEIPDIAAFKNAGLRAIRVDIPWWLVQKDEETWDFSRFDAIIKPAVAAGIRVVAILKSNHPQLCYTDAEKELYSQPHPELSFWPQDWYPIWDGLMPTRPDNLKKWLTFVHTVVSRYHGKGIVWEIWNEPNLNIFFGPVSDPTFYGQLLIETSKTIKSVSKHEIVGGMSTCCDWQDWADKVAQTGALSHLDVWTHHPYLRGHYPEDVIQYHWKPITDMMRKYLGKLIPVISSESAWTAPILEDLWSDELKGQVWQYREQLATAKNQVDHSKVWTSNDFVREYPANLSALLDTQMAEMILRMFNTSIKAYKELGLVVPVTIWYDGPETGERTGLFDPAYPNYSKPAYQALVNLKKTLDYWDVASV